MRFVAEDKSSYQKRMEEEKKAKPKKPSKEIEQQQQQQQQDTPPKPLKEKKVKSPKREKKNKKEKKKNQEQEDEQQILPQQQSPNTRSISSTPNMRTDDKNIQVEGLTPRGGRGAHYNTVNNNYNDVREDEEIRSMQPSRPNYPSGIIFHSFLLIHWLIDSFILSSFINN